MERCFIIPEGCKLHSDYMAYIDSTRKNNETIKMFFKENGIEANLYYVESDSFAIVPTGNDLKKFEKQLKKNAVATINGKGLYEFKKNSAIGKAYTALHLKVIHKPVIGFYIDEPCFRIQSRLFEHENILYATVESDQIKSDTDMPDGWKEIKKSEFYKIIEGLEE